MLGATPPVRETWRTFHSALDSDERGLQTAHCLAHRRAPVLASLGRILPALLGGRGRGGTCGLPRAENAPPRDLRSVGSAAERPRRLVIKDTSSSCNAARPVSRGHPWQRTLRNRHFAISKSQECWSRRCV